MKTEDVSIQVFGALLAILVGLVVAIITNFLDLRSRKKDQEETEKQQLAKTARAIAAELEFNLGIAKTPFRGRLIPFITTVFDTFQSDIINLPSELHMRVFGIYKKLVEANSIVQTDLHQLKWGSGYLNNEYPEKCKEIIESAEETKTKINEWLK